uniref:Tubulin-folding cofactor B n=1 Tax=Anthurium amnicola TaxID=1678845 RepID=A0A1D1XKB5_9ARAE
MGSRLQVPADDSVLLRVTHSNLKSFSADVRFYRESTVAAAKEKLWKKCGTSADSMRLELYDDSGAKVCDLGEDSRPLGFFSPQDGYRIHVVDLDPASVTSGGWLEDTTLVEKYKISDEAYNKRDCNFRKFREKLASENTSLGNKLPDNYMEELCASIKIGDRCEMEPGEKRGVVKFVGKAETLASGFWVGVELDEPLGKHDGTVKGKRYFECPPQHGVLLRPDKVKGSFRMSSCFSLYILRSEEDMVASLCSL